jgi:hypothetical protein
LRHPQSKSSKSFQNQLVRQKLSSRIYQVRVRKGREALIFEIQAVSLAQAFQEEENLPQSRGKKYVKDFKVCLLKSEKSGGKEGRQGNSKREVAVVSLAQPFQEEENLLRSRGKKCVKDFKVCLLKSGKRCGKEGRQGNSKREVVDERSVTAQL